MEKGRAESGLSLRASAHVWPLLQPLLICWPGGEFSGECRAQAADRDPSTSRGTSREVSQGWLCHCLCSWPDTAKGLSWVSTAKFIQKLKKQKWPAKDDSDCLGLKNSGCSSGELLDVLTANISAQPDLSSLYPKMPQALFAFTAPLGKAWAGQQGLRVVQTSTQNLSGHQNEAKPLQHLSRKKILQCVPCWH